MLTNVSVAVWCQFPLKGEFTQQLSSHPHADVDLNEVSAMSLTMLQWRNAKSVEYTLNQTDVHMIWNTNLSLHPGLRSDLLPWYVTSVHQDCDAAGEDAVIISTGFILRT